MCQLSCLTVIVSARTGPRGVIGAFTNISGYISLFVSENLHHPTCSDHTLTVPNPPREKSTPPLPRPQALGLGSVHVYTGILSGSGSRWRSAVSAAACLSVLGDLADPPEGIDATRRGRCNVGSCSSSQGSRRAAIYLRRQHHPSLPSGGGGVGMAVDAGTSSDSNDGEEVVEEGSRIGF